MSPVIGVRLLTWTSLIAPDSHQTTKAGPDVENKSNNESSAVRFSSAVEEIAPGPAPSSPEADDGTVPDNVAADQLREFTKSLHGRPLQARRMNTFQFEPFSLPASRVRNPRSTGSKFWAKQFHARINILQQTY